MKLNYFIKFVLVLLLCKEIYAQQKIFIPVEFQRAVDAGYRTLKGKPGKNYFQNSANYDIKSHFDPKTALLKGNAKIEYFNNSSDSLKTIVFRLYANLFKKGTVRQAAVEAEDVHDGVQIKQLKIKDLEIPVPKAKQHETIMIVPLNEKLAPKTSVHIEVDWEVTLPNKTLIRMGRYDTATYFVAYWYPQIAVYDDIFHWCTDSYTGLQEFYCDNANFNVQITVPKGHLVWATGVLQNEKQLFANNILAKIEKARKSDELVNIVTKQELEANQVLQNNVNEITWNFKADEVPDFAFGVSDSYIWDGTSVIVDSTTHRRVMANAVYHKNSKAGEGVAMIARRTIQALSHEIIGYPYPYPHNTVWEGHFGMEFPMMCNDGPVDDLYDEVFVTSHEVSHTYFPFLVGTNELHYAWIDEGLVTFLPKIIEMEYGNANAHYYINSYSRYAMGTSYDIPLSVPTTQMNAKTYMMQNYGRAAVGFYFLHDAIGKDMFKKVIHQYVIRWKGKHPTPTDLYFTLVDVTGQDWAWYWNPWFYQYGYADLAIEDVIINNNRVQLKVVKKGVFPVPMQLTIMFEDGSEEIIYEKATIWKDATAWSYKNEFKKKVKEIKLGSKNIPDAFAKNNVYTKR